MMFREIDSTLPAGSYYFSGNEAAAEGAIAAGCRYYAGYPITPSSELMERMAARFNEIHGVFMQMEDEIASICSVIGASWAGAKAMTATSGGYRLCCIYRNASGDRGHPEGRARHGPGHEGGKRRLASGQVGLTRRLPGHCLFTVVCPGNV